ncbi:MAG: glycosyltransferase family 2 protein [Clostridia bacterium]|nr:glycosyltransferase family 2 protein [Clostridia bacterium]
MEHKTLRAQTILYHNEISGLEKSLASLYKAVEVSARKGGAIDFIDVYFGDASAEPILTDEQIADFNRRFGKWLKVTYTFFGFNSGTSKGQNIMFKDCETDYFMAYNPDVIVCPNYFIEMLKPYERLEKVGLVEAKQSPLEHPKEFDAKSGIEPWGAMACVIIPTKVYRELGGLDEENFFLYCDDVDFTWRVRLAGYKVVYQSRAFVYHSKHVDNDGHVVPTNAELYYSAEAFLFMCHKWSNPELLKKLIAIYTNGTSHQKKALAEYYRRKENNLLPKPLDSQHKITSFYGFGYSKNRY